jgi:hypothetical protein
MLNVLLTIDTETYPITKGWKEDHLTADMKRDLYGEIDGRAVGLDYQLETFSKYGLKGNFMVESLFSAVPEVGPEPLKKIVRSIASGGHDIQIHPHTEWIPHIPDFDIPYHSHLLRRYSLHDQEAILRFAKARLEEAGAPTPVAFRAGGFAANNDTLIAVGNSGLKYDSSFNLCYQNGNDEDDLHPPDFWGHVTEFRGVQRLPVAVFQDRRSHFRPAQILACSANEMIHALDAAERHKWDFFVIVLHSFEMISCRRHKTKAPMIRQVVVDRFEKVCEFLGNHRDRFKTVGFSDLDLATHDEPEKGIKGTLRNTTGRMIEQAVHRVQTR